jgi:hypothetical protein
MKFKAARQSDLNPQLGEIRESLEDTRDVPREDLIRLWCAPPVTIWFAQSTHARMWS